MPLYEYRCTQCGECTEILQKVSDQPEKTCPYCHKDTLVKQISAPQFQLKGSGWYVTDFRDKKKPESKETKGADETKETKSETTTETTPEKKTDTKTDTNK